MDGLNLHSSEFNSDYVYDGLLGPSVGSEAAHFRLWAPTAVSVQLMLLGSGKTLHPLQKSCRYPGLWEREIQGDLRGRAYQFLLRFADGSCHVSNDPYARASTVNSGASVLLDEASMTPEGWQPRSLLSPLRLSEICLYELSLRDLSIAPDNGLSPKGQFLSLCQKDGVCASGTPSGLAYLKKLGVTHLQLMPVFDFGSIDEAGDLGFNAQYNWGYDPENYLVPEGSYASSPSDPAARIRELKTLIQILHQEGFRVIMDVVLNHVYHLDASPLHLTVPGYYFRYLNSGQPANSTYCGNETASEQPMFRRYMLDCLRYWVEAYGFDGFRMDLMGIHDCVTLREIRTMLDALDPQILLYGEGWSMGAQPEGILRSDQVHASEMPGVAFFNDRYRETLRSFACGDLQPPYGLYEQIQALPGDKSYLSPSQTLLYSECHDNLTLFDKLRLALPQASEQQLEERQMLALEIQALSHGILFVHAGQELCRSKGGIDNSYNSPDSVNAFPYGREKSFARISALFPELLQLRRSLPFLSVDDYAELQQQYQLLEAASQRLLYRVRGESNFEVYINGSDESWFIEPRIAAPLLHHHQVKTFVPFELREIPPRSLTLLLSPAEH